MLKAIFVRRNSKCFAPTVKRAMNLMRTTAAMKITTSRTQMIAETMMIVAVHTIHPGRLLTMLILESKEKL